MNDELIAKVAQIIMCTGQDVVWETALEAARDILITIQQN